jgi:NAD-dependent dihydropyrimidine dehydrogenase PreA subunit
MIGVYLSGTGNTEHCVKKLISLLDKDASSYPLSLNNEEDIVNNIKSTDTVVLAYPTQFSNSPYMVRDFIKRHKDIWQDKKVFVMTTMGMFSGDGTGCSARLLKKYGAKIIGGLQLKMPDAVCDSKLLKKSKEANKQIIVDADKRIEAVEEDITKNNKYPKEGLTFLAHLAGLFGQRLWFYSKTTNYSKKLKINKDKCAGCGACANGCPMNNLKIVEGNIVSFDKCTMCYKCITNCPKQAITCIGKEVVEQCKYEKYVN